jgi:hypothetical protein
LIGGDHALVNEIIEISDHPLPGRDPNQVERLSWGRATQEGAMEPFEKRLREGARLAATGPVGLMEGFEPVQKQLRPFRRRRDFTCERPDIEPGRLARRRR